MAKIVALKTEATEPKSFRTRPPWFWIFLGTSLTITALGYSWWQNETQKENLRARILRTHQRDLVPITQRYLKLTKDIESRLREIGAQEQKPFFDSRLNLVALHRDEGLYLRVRRQDIKDKALLEQVIKVSKPDAIPQCLGVIGLSVRDLFVRGTFLKAEWAKRVRKSQSHIELRAFDDELVRKVRKDLPDLQRMLRAKWLMIVVDNASERYKGPVDVYLWDLRSGQRLLSAHAQPNGELIRARIKDSPRYRLDPEAHAKEFSGAMDCAVVAQLKDAAPSAVKE